MSFSFTVCSKTKDEALAAVQKAMDEVVAGQPIHARDRDAVIASAKAAADQLHEDNAMDVYVSINGSLHRSTRGAWALTCACWTPRSDSCLQ